MTQITKTLVAPYSAEAMYDLVNDVRAYPAFLPWCTKTEVLEEKDGYIQASITAAKGTIKKTLVTKNLLEPHKKITMQLVDGPFSSFSGKWHFQAISPRETTITLDLTFELSKHWMNFLVEPIVNIVCNTLLDAFIARAKKIYD